MNGNFKDGSCLLCPPVGMNVAFCTREVLHIFAEICPCCRAIQEVANLPALKHLVMWGCKGDELQWQVLQHHPALQTLHVSLYLKQPVQKELLDVPQLHVLILLCDPKHFQDKVT